MTMKKGKIFILSGPSGSGKTTLHERLLLSRRLKGKLVKSISVTTRPKRRGEKQGRDYYFISQKEFLEKRKKRLLLEWQKVFDNFYGTPRKAVNKLLKKGKSVLLCIDVKGAAVVAEKCPQAVKIFVEVPSMDELKRRLKKRGSESPESLSLRLKIAEKEMKEAKKYHYVIVNDMICKAVSELERIILRELDAESE